MGNSDSKNDIKIINETYANILLDLNIKELINLTNSTNCNENVILLTDLLKKNPNNTLFLNKLHKKIYNTKEAIQNKHKTCENISQYYMKIANIYASIRNVYDERENKYCNKIMKYTNTENITNIQKFYTGVCDRTNGIFAQKPFNKPYYITTQSDRENNILKNKYKLLNKNFNIFTPNEFNEIVKIFRPNTDNNEKYNYKIQDIEIKYDSEKLKKLYKTCNSNNVKSIEGYDSINNSTLLQTVRKNINSVIENHINSDLIKNLTTNIETEKKKLNSILKEIFIIQDDKYVINDKLNSETLDDLTKTTRKSLTQIYKSCYEIYNLSIDLLKNIIENYSNGLPKNTMYNSDSYSDSDSYSNSDSNSYLSESQLLQDPRLQDPRLQDPRLQDPRLQDPRLQDPRLKESNKFKIDSPDELTNQIIKYKTKLSFLLKEQEKRKRERERERLMGFS